MGNKILRIALIKVGISGIELSEKTGIARSVISQIMTERVNPSTEEKNSISKVVNEPVSTLWPKGK